MKKYFIGFWYSMPVQLFLLHFRKYQIFLIFWYILFATVTGHFMKTFGGDSLYLAPEYFDTVSPLSTAITGIAIGIFIMSWNITTFILLGKYFRFLVTTAQPFLKYCINNFIIPLIFLIVYCVSSVRYSLQEELLSVSQIIIFALSFLGGMLFIFLISFAYFFGADKTIYYTIGNTITTANKNYEELSKTKTLPKHNPEVRVDWFLSARLHLRKPRDVRHYAEDFLNTIFNRLDIAAAVAIISAFLFLIGVGFISDEKLFQIPAAASITILFSVLIGASGAVNLFLRSWSIPLVLALYLLLNFLYQKEIIDPRNRAYGLNYTNKSERPKYDRENIAALLSSQNIRSDKDKFLQILNNWKAKQHEEKPIMFIVNTSGGGLRSANFTMHSLQALDSVLHGELMKKTLFMNGASGGLLGAAYFRELYREQLTDKKINLHDEQYVDNISKDLLNPLFSSFVSRDIVGPVQKFSFGGFDYTKDRGFAFEGKLNENTHGALNKTLNDYKSAEEKAEIPFMFFNSVVSRDGRKMIISSHPARFLMKPNFDESHITPFEPDAIDFNSFFAKQNSNNIGVLSALRMNATFPYVLPNVWLPTEPIIDVMDAGLRDNFGLETTLRFVDVFKDWLQENTSKVIVLQIRDRSLGDWDKPFESKSYIDLLTRPMLLLQNDWYKLQDYYQHDQLEYLAEAYGPQFYRICLQYISPEKDATASLSFHLTKKEKQNISSSLQLPINTKELKRLSELVK